MRRARVAAISAVPLRMLVANLFENGMGKFVYVLYPIDSSVSS